MKNKKAKPNIEIDLKKVLLITAFVFILLIAVVFYLISSAGGGDQTVNPVTQEANSALEQNDKDKALEILNKGLLEGTVDQAGADLFVELSTELYPIYLAEGQKAEESQDYQVAYESYSKALMTIPKDQDAVELEESIARTESLAIEQERLQKDFGTYVNTFQSAISDSNKLLQEFKVQMDGIETGKVTPTQLIAHVKEKIPASNEITTKLDSGLFIQNQDLLDLHKNVINHVDYQHNMFLSSLNMTDANKKEMVERIKSDILKLKQEQVNLLQTISGFAEEHHLDIELKFKEE